MRIKEILNQRFSAAMQAAGVPSECSPILALSGKPQFGDYQANGAMAAAKRLDADPFLGNGGLQIKLHVRRHGGTDDRHQQEHLRSRNAGQARRRE